MFETEPHVLTTLRAIWAVHKPSGMRVHPAGPSAEPDLVTWLAQQPDLPAGLTPVQRLDRGTSGVVLCAAERGVRAELSSWLTDGLIRKTYLAAVIGRTRKKGTIRRPLMDARRGRPLPAVTRYRTLEWLGGFSLVAVQIETGRKHQIRKHLSGIGHPLIGDERFRPRRRVRIPAWPDRLWLHARALELPTGETLEDPLPPRLVEHLETLRAGASTRGGASA